MIRLFFILLSLSINNTWSSKEKNFWPSTFLFYTREKSTCFMWHFRHNTGGLCNSGTQSSVHSMSWLRMVPSAALQRLLGMSNSQMMMWSWAQKLPQVPQKLISMYSDAGSEVEKRPKSNFNYFWTHSHEKFHLQNINLSLKWLNLTLLGETLFRCLSN